MKEGQQIDKALRDLIEIIHFTENVSAKVHGVLDEGEIYSTVTKEFTKSDKYYVHIFVLTDDGTKLRTVETAGISPEKLRAGEKASGLRLKDFRIDLNKSSACSQVVREGKTLAVNTGDLLRKLFPRRVADSIIRGMSLEKRTSILTPLRRGGEIIGVLSMSSTDLSEYLIPSVRNLAQHISSAFELADQHTERELAEEETRRRNEQIAAVNTIAQTVSQSLDLDLILSEALDKTLELIGVESGLIYLFREKTDDFWPVVHRGISEDILREVAGFKMGQGLSGQVAQSGEVLAVANVSEDGRNISSSAEREGVRALVAVPLRVRHRIVGVMTLATRGDRQFRAEDLTVLDAIGNRIGVAIENANMYQHEMQRVFEMEALRKTALDITKQLELSQLLRSITERAFGMLRAEAGRIWLYDPQNRDLELVIDVNQPVDFTGSRVKVGEGLSGKVAQTGEALIVEDYRHWEERSKQFDSIRIGGIIGVPLKWGDEIIGVLNVNEIDKPRRFDDHDLHLLTLFANQAAIAIENARLHGETTQRADELATLYDVSLDVASQLELPSLLETIVQRAIELLGRYAGGLYLYDPESQDLELIAAKGLWEDRIGVRLALGEGACGKAAHSGEALAVTEYANWEGRSPQFEDSPSFNSLAVPIKRGDTLLGALYVNEPDVERRFDESAIRLATLFANLAAVGIENARLYEAGQQELAQRKRAEETLRESEQKFRSIIEQSDDGISLINEDGAIIEWNRGQEQITGLKRSDILGQSFWDAQFQVVPEERKIPAVHRQLQDMMLGFLRTGQAPWLNRLLEQEIQRPGGTRRIIQTSVAPIKTAKGMMAASISRDITERKQAEEELRKHHDRLEELVEERTAELRALLREREQAQARLIHSEKMVALGQLSASVAHEINNPLQSVQGCLELAEEELNRENLDGRQLWGDLRDYLRVARGEIERISIITSRMRDFYRPEHEKLQPTDQHALLDSVLELTSKQLEHSNVAVEREWAEGLPVIRAHPAQLKQVFLNLVLNAIDAMPTGGTLCMRTALDQIQAPGDQRSLPAVRIEFSDTGKGIPAEILSHIFEPFFTTKEDGSGLGLSISYAIIESHHGQIIATSEVGVGTTFTILLPVEQP